MKSTPRNLMAGMNVSRDQKVGRAHQRAKGLPQDGVHAGGQTYDSSKPSETTSNHQTTTSDYEYGEGSFFCRRCWRGSTPVMQIHQLRYFCAVARTGSFTRAAEQEHLAQPSLSEQVRKLEDERGTRLFDRLGRSPSTRSKKWLESNAASLSSGQSPRSRPTSCPGVWPASAESFQIFR